MNASVDIIIMNEKEFINGIKNGDPILIGFYTSYDPIIGKKWLRKYSKHFDNCIKNKKIKVVVGGILWDRENLIS